MCFSQTVVVLGSAPEQNFQKTFLSNINSELPKEIAPNMIMSKLWVEDNSYIFDIQTIEPIVNMVFYNKETMKQQMFDILASFGSPVVNNIKNSGMSVTFRFYTEDVSNSQICVCIENKEL